MGTDLHPDVTDNKPDDAEVTGVDAQHRRVLHATFTRNDLVSESVNGPNASAPEGFCPQCGLPEPLQVGLGAEHEQFRPQPTARLY
jgi:hypothetical protein